MIQIMVSHTSTDEGTHRSLLADDCSGAGVHPYNIDISLLILALWQGIILHYDYINRKSLYIPYIISERACRE